MTESESAISEFVQRGIAAQAAADRMTGRPTAAEMDHEDEIGELRGRLGDEIDTAVESVRRARRVLAQLSGSVFDVEYADGDLGADLAVLIDSARRDLLAVRAQMVSE